MHRYYGSLQLLSAPMTWCSRVYSVIMRSTYLESRVNREYSGVFFPPFYWLLSFNWLKTNEYLWQYYNDVCTAINTVVPYMCFSVGTLSGCWESLQQPLSISSVRGGFVCVYVSVSVWPKWVTRQMSPCVSVCHRISGWRCVCVLFRHAANVDWKLNPRPHLQVVTLADYRRVTHTRRD